MILGVLALAVVAMLIVFGREPSDSPPRETCTSQGIDPEVRNEGTCYGGDQKTLVVDPGHRLELEKLDARTAGVKESADLIGEDQIVPPALGVIRTYRKPTSG